MKIMDHALLEGCILKALPNLPDAQVHSILSVLDKLGVETEEELQFVVPADLDNIPAIKARKLLKFWRSKAENNEPDETSTPQGPSSSQGISTGIEPASDNYPRDDSHKPSSTDWSQTYKVPWHKLPAKLIEACNKGQKPDPKDRRAMIRIIMDEINGVHVTPKRKELRIVAQQVVRKFSKSFADTINGVTIGDGSSTLLQQLESRKENLQRQSGLNRLHKQASTSNESEPLHKKSKTKFNSYGCVKGQWQPDLLEGESHDTQEQKRELLKVEYEKLPWCTQTVDDNMKATYSTQRFEINNGKSVEDVLKQWPFLAEEKWLLDHFHSLTGIDLQELLNDSLMSKASRLFEYLKTKSNPASLVEVVHQIKTTVSKQQNKLAVIQCLPCLLAAYFKEDISVLIRCYDDMVTRNDISDLPSTLCIAVIGNMYSPNAKHYLAIDGNIINSVKSDKALTMMFAAYYVFNIHYTKEASCTLDFVQRFFMGINPSDGSKTGVKKRDGNVSGKVFALATAMALFESDWTQTNEQ